KWAQAVEKIEALAKKGDATEEQMEALLDGVRDAVTPEINALSTRALGQKDAPAALREIDRLAKLAHWAVVDAGAPAPQVGKAMPEDLAKKRAVLAVWAEAQRMAMRPLSKPEVRYTWGKVEVHPPAKGDAPSKQDIPHGAQIWILGIGHDKALVTT